jgi:hypothetical protein
LHEIFNARWEGSDEGKMTEDAHTLTAVNMLARDDTIQFLVIEIDLVSYDLVNKIMIMFLWPGQWYCRKYAEAEKNKRQ